MNQNTEKYLESIVASGDINVFFDIARSLFGDVDTYPKTFADFENFVDVLLKSHPLPQFKKSIPVLSDEQLDFVYKAINHAPGRFGDERVALHERFLGIKIDYDIAETLAFTSFLVVHSIDSAPKQLAVAL